MMVSVVVIILDMIAVLERGVVRSRWVSTWTRKWLPRPDCPFSPLSCAV